MAHRADNSPQDIQETRHNIEDTRSAMTEKLTILEERVREIVAGAHSSVEEIIKNVKDMVDSTVVAVGRPSQARIPRWKRSWRLSRTPQGIPSQW